MADVLNFLGWYLLVTLVGLVSLPVAWRLFPGLPGRGIALARPLGLLLWGFAFWLLCSLGVLQNDLGGVLFSLAMVIAFSVFCAARGRFAELKTWLKANLSSLISMELLFLVAFVMWTVVRAANPDVTYTEKPMELAFINAILRSPAFPPFDPWLSGYAISYYYFGYVIVSMLIRVTGVAASVGFNLATSLWFAMTALAVFGVVFELLVSRRPKGETSEPVSQSRARTGALLGPLFVLLISSLEGVLEFIYSWGWFWKAGEGGVLTSKFWTWLSISELDVAPVNAFSLFPSRPGAWLWWRGSRVIQDLGMSGNRIEVIGEFPFFSYLLADLHPHVLAMPFVLLAITFCLNLFLGVNNAFSFEGPFFQWFKRLDFWMAALIFGSLAFLNTWDFPIYVGLFCVVLMYRRVNRIGWGWTRAWEFLKAGLFIALGGIFLFLPFYIGFSSQAGGILPSLEFMTRGVHFWIVFGALLIPISIWVVWRLFQQEKPIGFGRGIKIASIIFAGLFLASMLFGILAFQSGGLAEKLLLSANPFLLRLGQKMMVAYQAFSGLHQNFPLSEILTQTILRRLQSPGTWVTLFVLFAALWALLFSKSRTGLAREEDVQVHKVSAELQPVRPEIFVYLILLVGTILTLFPEFFYLRDQFGTRMNTIFKFYFQAWILWGIAAAFASVELLGEFKGIRKQLFGILWVVVISCGLAYPLVMLPNKTNNFKPERWTLDGNAFLSIYDQDDYLAIQFLQDKPLGVIAEAIGGSYAPEYAKISARTGMPTVLGWPGHEGQWRGGYEEVGSREPDIRLLYTTTDWGVAQSMLDRYGIRYVYLGNTEKSHYQTDGKLFFENLAIFYQNNSVTIFEVPARSGEAAR